MTCGVCERASICVGKQKLDLREQLTMIPNCREGVKNRGVKCMKNNFYQKLINFYASYIHNNTHIHTHTSQSSLTLVPFIITGTVVSAACSDIPHY